MQENGTIISTRGLNLYYGSKQALIDVSIDIRPNNVTALIGPSGCGKSTLLRCFNRMNDLVNGAKIDGECYFKGKNIYAKDVDVVGLRRKIGMVFQKPNPFPKSIYDNIAYGPRIHGIKNKKALDEIVQRSLKSAAL
ncbi:MAG: ATP-binding cassette domain-containing protein, partial [Methanomicrobiaceae archaeon]|nr:ATP-binding cassette domain-containing protein [Methanomicrobiaceae archaeon]